MTNQVLFNKTVIYYVANSPVTLTITIGDNQVGGSSVVWHGQSIAQGVVQGLPVGAAGESLVGQLLICTTTVQDVNTATNHTSVTYTLSGGAQEQSFPYTIDVSEPGGLAIYTITFVFI